MAEGGIIYTKDINTDYQDGKDNSLIIQPNYAYIKPLNVGSDWEEIIIAICWSYTFSSTDNNKGSENDHAGADWTITENSGSTTNDTFSYIGICNNTETKYLPTLAGTPLGTGEGFLGFRYGKIYAESTSQNRMFLADNRTSNNGPNTTFMASNEVGSIINDISTNTYSSRSNCWALASPVNTSEIDDFCNVWAIRVKVYDKGLSSQRITLEKNSGFYGSHYPAAYTGSDPSLGRLKEFINSFSNSRNSIVTYDWVDANNNPLAIPDSFYFYNAFLNTRPRIHSIAVKKIS
jgi:hypothetical protein